MRLVLKPGHGEGMKVIADYFLKSWHAIQVIAAYSFLSHGMWESEKIIRLSRDQFFFLVLNESLLCCAYLYSTLS